MTGYIFGGNTGQSYEDLQRKRKIAEAMLANRPNKISNVGEGINHAASSIAAALLGRRADKDEAAQREEFERRMYGGGSASTSGGRGFRPSGESRVDVSPMGRGNQPPASGTAPPSAPMSRGTDPMDPRRGVFPTEARAEYSGMADIDYSLGPKRPEKPGSEVQIAARRAAAEVFGPGSRVEVYSGMGDYGSPRHRQGHAADVRIYDPEGNLVSVDDPRVTDFAQAFARAGGQGFGAGEEYMGAHGFHLDVYPREQYTSSMGPAWGSVGDAVEASFVGTQPGSDPVQTGTGLEGYSTAELRQLAGSPYASDFDRQLIQTEMEARMAQAQPPDPMEAARLQNMELRNAQLMSQMTGSGQPEWQIEELEDGRTYYVDPTGQQAPRLVNPNIEPVQEADLSGDEQKIARIMEIQNPQTGQPYSREEAIRIADLVRVSRDPMTGEAELVDLGNLPAAQNEAAAQPMAPSGQPEPTLSFGPEVSGNADAAFGVRGMGARAINSVSDALTGQEAFPQVAAEQRFFDVLQEDLLVTLAQGYGRQPAQALMERLRNLLPQAGTFQGPGGAQGRLDALRSSLATELEAERQGLRRRMQPADRSAAEQRVQSLENAVAQIEGALGRFDGEQSGTTASGIRWSIE